MPASVVRLSRVFAAVDLLAEPPLLRTQSCCTDEPVAEIVPNTQPAFAHLSGALRLGRLLSASPREHLSRRRLSRRSGKAAKADVYGRERLRTTVQIALTT